MKIIFKKLKYIFYIIWLYFFIPGSVDAATTGNFSKNYFDKLREAAGVGKGGFGEVVKETDLATRIGMGINLLIGLVGTLFLILVVYGGFIWMLARGSSEEIERAKKIITNSSIGLGITLAAYIITRTIIAIFI